MKALAQHLHTKLAWTKYPISSGTDRQTDRRTDRQTDGRTDGRTDGQAQPYIPSFSRGIIIRRNAFRIKCRAKRNTEVVDTTDVQFTADASNNHMQR